MQDVSIMTFKEGISVGLILADDYSMCDLQVFKRDTPPTILTTSKIHTTSKKVYKEKGNQE